MPDFTQSFNFFKAKLEAGEPFALARFGDGELNILRNAPIGNAEFQYDGDPDFCEALSRAFTFQHPKYYVGIGCPCCIGGISFKWMRNASGQNVWHLTYNNIFVNANYQRFMTEIVPIFEDKNAFFIGPEEGRSQLDYRYGFLFPVTRNAWRFADDYIEELEKHISKKSPSIFLFSAGPLSEVLIHRAMLIRSDHTYIDIGSTLDPILFGHPTRGYHVEGSATSNKVCHWG